MQFEDARAHSIGKHLLLHSFLTTHLPDCRLLLNSISQYSIASIQDLTSQEDFSFPRGLDYIFQILDPISHLNRLTVEAFWKNRTQVN